MTLAGQSAGALGVTTLMAVPRAAGLFHAAIAQSSPLASVVGRSRGDERAERVIAALGATGSPAEALAEVDPFRLLAAAEEGLASEQEEFPGILSYASVVDGDLLPENPLDVLAEGRAHPVPLLIGTTENEGTLFARGAKVPPAHKVEKMFTHAGSADAARLRGAYPGLPRRGAATALSGDFLFWAPSVRAAEGHARVAPVWMYRYDYATPLLHVLRLGATHGMDLMAVFGPANSELGRKAHLLGGRKGLEAVSALMQNAWMRMVTTHAEAWDKYSLPDRRTLIITPRPRVEADPRAGRREAWESFSYYD